MENRNVFGRSRPRRRGSITVLTAIMTTIVLIFAAFVVDFYRMTQVKAELQNVADAAAISSSQVLARNQSYLRDQASRLPS